jgi:aryl-alcohol dehydrogenase-like predicted oxidoreductase
VAHASRVKEEVMIFNRLAIGTANWGKEYNGAKVSEDDQKQILDYCHCAGIDMIDTATAYEWDWTKVSTYFNVVVKINIKDSLERIKGIIGTKPYCIMAHEPSMYRELTEILRHQLPKKWGVSVYEYSDFPQCFERAVDILQVPYSLYDRRIEKHFQNIKYTEIHVRSVFLRGKIIQAGVEPWKCIAFCLMNPYVDRVIIGADSYEQFKENLRPFHRMDVMKKEDLNLIDPRRWKNEEE